MKIFMTGTESFIGSRLWELCHKHGHELTGVDAIASTKPGVTVMDLRDRGIEEVVPADSVVVHLAAVSTDALCKSDTLEAFDVNIAGTINVLRAAVRAGCRQVIFASTEWVYGDCTDGQIQVEDQPIDVMRMSSAYAFSKVVGERVVAFSGLPNATILRFGIVYGPRLRNWCAVESFFDKVRRGIDFEIGSARTARKFIHVDDLCRGILASIGLPGVHTINLAGDDSVTLGDVVRVSQDVTGRRVHVRETAPEKPSVRNPDNARAKKLLKWRQEVSFDNGLRTLADYMANMPEGGRGA